MDAFSTLQEKKADLQKAMSEIGETGVKERIKRFFLEVPEAKQVGWVQYTPYFNDGEPCIFSLHGVGIKYINSFFPDPIEYNEEDYGMEWIYESMYYLKKSVDITVPRTQEVIKLSEEFIVDIENCEELLFMVFGDHAQVTATPNTIVVEQYDHE